MNLLEFIALELDETMSHEQASQLNRELSKLAVLDIPKEGRLAVVEYLSSALAHNSVDPNHAGSLDQLLADLQEYEN